MGMGDLPPRQKMINLMYLVLLVLLAMNVSKEILNSFIIINEGLERTNKAFQQKNEYIYTQFKKKMIDDPQKVGPYYNAAKKVKDLSAELDYYIGELKTKIIATVEEKPEEVADTLSLWAVENKDNYDKPTHILIGPEPTNPKDGEWSALELRGRIEGFNKNIMDVLPADVAKGMDLAIPLEKVPEGDLMVEWEIGNFYHMPLASIITNLTRYQAEVKNVESDVIKALFGRISADDFAFDAVKLVVNAPSTYITLGDSFKAEVLVAAYSSTQNPVLHLGDVDSSTMSIENPDTAGVSYKNGIASYGVAPTTPGEYTWGGLLKIKKPNGELTPYQFEHTFTVAKPNLVVSPTKMNVFYRGLNNPISVSVPGVPSDKLQVNISNASQRKTGAGMFDVNPGSGKLCKVTVTAEMSGGKKQTFKPMEFRVKPVPPPMPELMGKKGSFKMSKGELSGASVLVAKLDDFLFDLQYKVTKFDVSVSVGGMTSTFKSPNNRLTSEMKNTFKQMKSGQKIIVENISAMRMPNGKAQSLDGNLIIEIK